MTHALTPTHKEATEQLPETPTLLMSIFAVMSGESAINSLKTALATTRSPEFLPATNPQTAEHKGTLSFRNYEGDEEFAFSVTYNANSKKLSVTASTPKSGLHDRPAIASALRSILKRATNNEIDFKPLERDISHEHSPTNNAPIDYKGKFDVPNGLEERLAPIARETIQRWSP